jgi:hypothetical protein
MAGSNTPGKEVKELRKKFLSKGSWVVVWLVLAALMFLVYPGQTSFIAGWIPVSMVLTFGLMLVFFIVSIFFVYDMLDF